MKISEENIRVAEKVAQQVESECHYLYGDYGDEVGYKKSKAVHLIATALQQKDDEAAKLVEASRDVLLEVAEAIGWIRKGEKLTIEYLANLYNDINAALVAYEAKPQKSGGAE